MLYYTELINTVEWNAKSVYACIKQTIELCVLYNNSRYQIICLGFFFCIYHFISPEVYIILSWLLVWEQVKLTTWMSPSTSTRPFDRGGITPGPVRKKGKEQEVPYQWVTSYCP